jgi:type IV pilus assembly protein PilB
VFRGAGCNACNGTGFKGRIGLFELMVLNDELRELIMEGASADRLRMVAKKHGMRPLRDIGMDFLYQGLTTADEVIRETIQDA